MRDESLEIQDPANFVCSPQVDIEIRRLFVNLIPASKYDSRTKAMITLNPKSSRELVLMNLETYELFYCRTKDISLKMEPLMRGLHGVNGYPEAFAMMEQLKAKWAKDTASKSKLLEESFKAVEAGHTNKRVNACDGTSSSPYKELLK